MARGADDFVESIGVATHLTYGDTAYRNYPLIAQRLSESGIRHIRDGWGTGSSYANDFVRDTLGPLGVKVTMVHDPRNNASAVAHKDMVKRELLPVVAGVESLNEWDTRGAGWQTEARNWTIDMSNAYRSDPATRGIPLLGPSMADTLNTSNHASMGDLSPYLDFGNTHDYPGDAFQMTDQIVDAVERNMAQMVPGRKIIATETGFSNGTGFAPYPAMPEPQVAVVLPRLYLEHFRRGLPRTFSYELLDQHPNNDFESRFGLVRNDGSKKPAFDAVAALTRLLSDKGPAFTPSALNYSLGGTDDKTRTLLLQKRDGTFWLALWQQERVFQGSSVLNPPNRPVTLSLAGSARSIRTHNLTNASPTATYANTGAVNVESSENVTLIEIAGVAATQPPAAGPPVTTPPTSPSTGTPPAGPTSGVGSTRVAVSDVAWRSSTNGWGPVERNQSNGELAAGDGRALTIAGKTFAKGIGAHSTSDVRVAVNGARTFTAQVGIDDETNGGGSVTFEVWADGTRLAQTGVLRGRQAAQPLSVDVTGRTELRLVVTDGADGNGLDHANWAEATLHTPAAVAVSDVAWRSSTNGWGPVERNQSNGELAAGDGRALTIAGKTFAKGIGAHSTSDVRVAVNGARTFTAQVGIDDETNGGGSVTFEVWADGTRLAQTGVLRGRQAAQPLSVDVTGRTELRLVVTDGADGNGLDHANWAEATLAL